MPYKIQKGPPPQNGQYIGYITSEYGEEFPFADKEILTFIDGHWYRRHSEFKIRDKVFGWIGPIPAMKINDNTNTEVKK